MKEILKIFGIITGIFIIMLIFVFKPYRNEVVDLDRFTEYYSDADTLEEGGGFELVDKNFYTIEKEYRLEEVLEGVPLTEDEQKEAYKVPKLEEYTVVSGDTLGGIAKKYGITLEILKANNQGISKSLKIGQKINIVKSNGIFYKVKRGDSLLKIALTYKVDIDVLKKYNNLKTDNIQIGEELFIYNPSEETLRKLTKDGSKIGKKSFRMPVPWAGVTSPFGKRFHPVLKRYIYHAGVDLRARYIPLHAAKDGVVIYAGYMSGYGRIIRVRHTNRYETRYAHLSKIYVKVGQKIKAGQIIGVTGMSGRVTGPHLHFEVRKNGKPRNPLNYLIR